MVHKIKTRFLCVLCFLAVGLGLISSVISISNAYAEAGDEGGVDGGNCGDYWDTCFGATWQYYPTTENTVTIYGNKNVDGGTIEGCGQYGGYYRLGLATHRNGKRQAVNTKNETNITQFGLVQVYTIYHNNWTRVGAESPHPNLIAFRDTDKWGISWNKAKELFDVAEKNNATNGFEWREVSWFCYDKKWDSPTTEFQSKSKVESDGSFSESLSWDQNAQDLEVQADEDGKATVNFSHRLRYNTETLEGDYAKASTTYTITIDDGSGGPWRGNWETDGNKPAESQILPENATISTVVTLGENEESKRVCSEISYTTKTLNWDNSNPHAMVAKWDTGRTEACAVIKKTEKKIEGVGQIEFWSQSSVESVDEVGRDIANHKEWTKERTTGDKVTLQLSTDYNNGKANFSHGLSYEVVFAEGKEPGENDTIELDNMKTTWTVDLAAGGTATGTYVIPSISSSTELAIVYDNTKNYVVNIPNPGFAEEKIAYEKKIVPITREEKKDGPCNTVPETNTCSWDPKRYRYYAEENTGNGKGDSAARIEYVNPNEPDDSNGRPSSSGGANGGPMYAGESAGMAWRGYAEPIEARRVIEDRSVAFEVLYSKTYNSSATKGDVQENLKHPRRSKLDPCQYWNQLVKLGIFRSGTNGCAIVGGATRIFGDGIYGDHPAAYAQTMVIPDYVGDKYCNSFAFRWKYYWGVKHTGDADFSWNPESDENRFTYWTHYDAACRTIAKKPSFVAWNGGVFANGGIFTSIASRYENPILGAMASGFPNASFGSWTEHLGVANGGILNFGTGGSLAFGSNSIGVSINSNSPLTIRNDIALGSAGITKNPTLVSRLSDYLSDIPETEYHSESEVNIYSSIVSNGGADDIYSLPQKIIYAPNASKVNIYSGATQIDAWIIAPNAVINTCADFTSSNGNPGGTETRPAGSHPCDTPLRVNGPVVASSLKLNRTGGADITNDGDNYTAVLGSTYINDWQKYTPAEVFNLSADTYLWAYAQAGRYGSSYTEAYSRELPPRY